jgi:hypothetical protein
VKENLLPIAVGVLLASYGLWRWRTPPNTGTAASWRLFGAKYEERPETQLERADRKIRQGALAVVAGTAFAIAGVIGIISDLI